MVKLYFSFTFFEEIFLQILKFMIMKKMIGVFFTLLLVLSFNLKGQEVVFDDYHTYVIDFHESTYLDFGFSDDNIILNGLLRRFDTPQARYIHLKGELVENKMNFTWQEYEEPISIMRTREITGNVLRSGNGICTFSEKEYVDYVEGFMYMSLTIIFFDDNSDETETFTAELVSTGCLSSKTQITLWDGSLKTVTDLAVGDKLISYDIATQSEVLIKVTALQTFDSPQSHLRFSIVPLQTEANSQQEGKQISVQTTALHPFLTKAGTKKAGELVIGDILILENGEEGYLQNIQEVEVSAGEKVYNPITEGNKPYFADGVLVLPK